MRVYEGLSLVPFPLHQQFSVEFSRIKFSEEPEEPIATIGRSQIYARNSLRRIRNPTTQFPNNQGMDKFFTNKRKPSLFEQELIFLPPKNIVCVVQ